MFIVDFDFVKLRQATEHSNADSGKTLEVKRRKPADRESSVQSPDDHSPGSSSNSDLNVFESAAAGESPTSVTNGLQLVCVDWDSEETLLGNACVSPLPENLKDAFEIATGWELAWRDYPIGKVEIVDMSAKWPARKATANRADCDRLAAEISSIVCELDQTLSSGESNV